MNEEGSLLGHERAPSITRETAMDTTFNYEDYGFPDQTTFLKAMTCGPIVRFEIRHHSGKARRAEARLVSVRRVLQSETEQAMESTGMTRFMEGWVKVYEKDVEYCQARAAYLRKLLADNF